MNYWLLLVPLLTALSGWIIILIIRISLFRPVVPVNVLGFHLQGLFPKNRQAIIARIGDLAASTFSASFNIEKEIKDPRHFEAIKPVIESHMDDFLRNRLKDQMPMIGMFIGDKTIESLKAIFIKEIEDLFPRIMQQFSAQLQNETDIRKLVATSLAKTDSNKLEHSISNALAPIFKKAAGLSIVAGLLIGIIQLLIVLTVTH
jgi:uncharacterized membrane protein YheB (UPF0754 family)